MVSGARVTPGREIKRQRRRRAHSCWDHLIIAPLWPNYGVNLGTLLRTCDAVGACMAVPKLPWVPEALDKGNTLRRPACVHWTGRDPVAWLSRHRGQGSRIVGVELADESIRLADLSAARERTIVVLGHEHDGIPGDVRVPRRQRPGRPRCGPRACSCRETRLGVDPLVISGNHMTMLPQPAIVADALLAVL